MEEVERPRRYGVVREVVVDKPEHLVDGSDPETRDEHTDILSVTRRSACHDLHGEEMLSGSHHDAKVTATKHDPSRSGSR